MRRILFNQSNFKPKSIVQEITAELYKLIIKNPHIVGDSKLVDIVEYSTKFYDSNNFYPSVENMKEFNSDFEYIAESFPTELDAESYVKHKDKFYRDARRQDLVAKTVQADTTIQERLQIYDELIKLDSALMGSAVAITDSDEYDLIDKYDQNKNKKKSMIKFFLPEVDAITGGMLKGKLATGIAGPKHGKSGFAMNMCYGNIMIPDNNALFISLEVPEAELLAKLTLRHSVTTGKKFNAPVREILSGTLQPEDEEIYKWLCEDFKQKRKSKLFIMDNTKINIESIGHFKAQLKDIIETNNIQIIYLDYIQLLKNWRPASSKNFNDIYDYLNEMVGMIRNLAVTTHNGDGTAVVLLSQISMEGLKRAIKANGALQASDVAEINALVRDSYYMIGFFALPEEKRVQINHQLLLHRDGENFEDPKKVQVDFAHYFMGDLSIDYKSMLNTNAPIKTVSNQPSNLELFGSMDIPEDTPIPDTPMKELDREPDGMFS